MNARYLITILAIVASFCPAARAQEHLEPEEGVWNAGDYSLTHASKIREKLLKGGPTYYRLRMIGIPAFEPEWVVTVVREEKEEETPDDQLKLTDFVEFAGAEKDLWAAGDHYRDVPVKKTRVAIDRETAEAVHGVWRRMLRGVRYPKEPRLGADGISYHFSRRVPLTDDHGGFEDGTIWTPDDGSLTGKLATIGESLKKYALAKPAERDKIRTEIREQVKRLEAKLDRARPSE